MTGSEHDRRKYEDIRRRKEYMTRGRRGYHAYITPPHPPSQSLAGPNPSPPSSAGGPRGEDQVHGARGEGQARGERRRRRQHRPQGGGAARGNEREVGFDSGKVVELLLSEIYERRSSTSLDRNNNNRD